METLRGCERLNDDNLQVFITELGCFLKLYFPITANSNVSSFYINNLQPCQLVYQTLQTLCNKCQRQVNGYVK